MISRNIFKISRRFTSAVAGPRAEIAKNYMLLEAIQGASSEAELANVVKSNPSVDFSKLPDGLNSMGTYFTSAATATGSATGFQQDNSSWQYRTGSDFAAEAGSNDDHFPFIVSAMYVPLFCSCSSCSNPFLQCCLLVYGRLCSEDDWRRGGQEFEVHLKN